MTRPTHISKPALNFARNAALLEGAGAALLALCGINFLVPFIVCLTMMTLLVGGNLYNRYQLSAATGSSPLKGLNERVRRRENAQSENEGFTPVSYSGNMGHRKFMSEYDCPNYDQVQFEMKLVDEGVIDIQDVSICDHAKNTTDCCILCHHIVIRQKNERDAKEEAERAELKRQHEKDVREANLRCEKRATASDNAMLDAMEPADAERVKVWSQSRFDEKTFMENKWGGNVVEKYPKGRTQCKTCKTDTMLAVFCPNCSLKSLRERDEHDRMAAEAEKERQFQERRNVNVSGVKVLRPLAVPEGAVPSILHGRDIDPLATHSYIVWKWTEDGKETKFFKQPISIDAYSIVSDSAGVVKTLYSAYDEDTGEYLGDYTTENGHLPKERHEMALKAHFHTNNEIRLVHRQHG